MHILHIAKIKASLQTFYTQMHQIEIYFRDVAHRKQSVVGYQAQISF